MQNIRDIEVEKIVLNVGCGTKLNPEVAKTVLERLAGKKAVIIRSRERSTFNVPKDKPIGCKVTIRKNKNEFLNRLLEAREGKLKSTNFDLHGNFAFGIKEYIDVPGMEYDPKIGIIGMDACITLQRKGYSIKRKMVPRKIGKSHLIGKSDAIDFVKNKFNVQVEEA